MNRAYVFCIVVALSAPVRLLAGDAAGDMITRLTTDGVTIAGRQVKLTPLWIVDGATASDQSAVVDKLAGRRKKPFYNDSINATVESNIKSIKDGNRRAGYVVDFGFIVYASLDDLLPNGDEEKAGLGALAGESDMKIQEVTPELLATAGITNVELKDGSSETGIDPERPRLIHGQFTLLDQVHISTVVRSAIRKSDESITVAWEQDDRFTQAPQISSAISNTWRFTNSDETTPGNAYNGFAGYAKVTKLKAREGALLVEYHYAFAEPKEWSKRRISLRAKLSIVLQESVRKSRRHIKKMAAAD